jgi:hypothetical protein
MYFEKVIVSMVLLSINKAQYFTFGELAGSVRIRLSL